jgi:hypothetical protein
MARFCPWRLMRMFAPSIGVTSEASQRGYVIKWPKNVIEETAEFRVCSIRSALGPPRLITNVGPP